MSHTAGPWTGFLDERDGHAAWLIGPSSARPILAEVSADAKYGLTGATVEANARLIAGAPTMADALLWIRENLHPQALGRPATDAELYAITHATFALRAAGVIPTPELTEAQP